MSRASLLGFLAAMLLACVGTVAADERILDYHSDVRVLADGSLDVTETIRVRAEGTNIRRGIYRTFPLRYKDRAGNRVVVDFELIGVERDGLPTPYFTESHSNGIRINTGDDSFLEVPRDYTFAIRYRTRRQLGFFVDHDEIYWNVTGLDWMFQIDRASADITLPTAVPLPDMRVDGYTGPYGAQGKDWTAVKTAPGHVRFHTTAPLGPQQGLTVVVGFPKGLVVEPTATQKATWFLRDNGGALVALVGLLALLGFYGWRWNSVGRDPKGGPVFPRYEPPTDLGPAEVRMLRRMSYDNRCFAADVVDMAVRGYLEIHSGDDDEWTLKRRESGSQKDLTETQRAIALKLFAGSNVVELKNTEATRVGGARTAQNTALVKRLEPKYYISNAGSLGLGVLFSVVVAIVAFVVAAGNGIPAVIVLLLLALVAHGVFGRLLRAPTKAGRLKLDEIEGLRMYLSVAERDEIHRQPTPSNEPALDPDRYEQLLPYAMALDVEAAWTKKFTEAVGVSVARDTQPGWYHGRAGTPLGLAGLGSSLGSALTQQISSSATPPGSSSGGGGGGFSGGGGGGGGGGGR